MSTPNLGLSPQVRTNVSGVLTAEVGFADDGTAVTLGNLPRGAIVTGINVIVVEAFNGATGDTLDIGLDADPDYFVAAADLSSLAQLQPTPAAAWATAASAQASGSVTATYTDATGDASAGVAQVVVTYVETF